MLDHPCYCEECMQYRFENCSFIGITRSDRAHILMKQKALETVKSDPTYIDNVFKFYQRGSHPTIFKSPVAVCLKSMSLEDIEADEIVVPQLAIMVKVISTRIQESPAVNVYTMDIRLLEKLGNDGFSYRVREDDAAVTVNLEDIVGPSKEELESETYDRRTFLQTEYNEGIKCYIVDNECISRLQIKLTAIRDDA